MKMMIILCLILMSCVKTPHQRREREAASVPGKARYFEDVTLTAGVSEADSLTVVAGDYNNDGWPDFIARDRLYRNISSDKGIKFVDVTIEVGLSDLKGHPSFVDISNDGLLDIVTTVGQLYIQKNGVYTESSKQLGLKVPSNVYSLSFGDLNKDGWVDLLFGLAETHKDGKFTFEPPMAFINKAGKKFVDVSGSFRFSQYPAYTRGMLWSDFNRDGVPDVYFANYRLRQNFLMQFQNRNAYEKADFYGIRGNFDANKYFDKRTNANYGPRYGHTIGAIWADLNNDGLLDLWTSNLVHKFVGVSSKGKSDIRGYVCDDSKIYKNLGAPSYKFVDVRDQSGIPLKAMGDYSVYKGDELWAQTTAADIDNDGLLDVYVSQVYDLAYAHALLFKNDGNFKFTEVSATEPIRIIDSYAAAWADFDNDGRVDLVSSGRGAVGAAKKLRIFKNIHANTNKYLKIKLVGIKSGRNPVTTQVLVTTDNGQVLRQYEGVTGTLNQQNDSTLYFGLGNATQIKDIEIRWNSGLVQHVSGGKLNSTRLIYEGR